jgi:Cd2+/Zn2+-exporting ATPase
MELFHLVSLIFVAQFQLYLERPLLFTSALTGESVPRTVKVGDEILGGFINKNGALTINVTKKFGDSTVSKILDLVENASS